MEGTYGPVVSTQCTVWQYSLPYLNLTVCYLTAATLRPDKYLIENARNLQIGAGSGACRWKNFHLKITTLSVYTTTYLSLLL